MIQRPVFKQDLSSNMSSSLQETDFLTRQTSNKT